MEFRDFLCTSYDITPPNFQRECNGCDTSFSVRHELRLRKGVLVIACHNKVRHKILYLARRAFPYTCVRGKPLIRQGRRISEGGYVRGVTYWIQ